VIELDDRLLRLQGQAREWAAEMRPYALEIDRNPDAIYQHLHLAAMSRVATLQIPPEYNPDPLTIGTHRFYLMGALERVVFFEEGAWGDLGMMLASPGPPMSGVLVAALGDHEQKEWFYGRMLERPTWTFFALTEPERGSDASAMSTRLTPSSDGGWTLTGAKRYVGNAVRGQLGVVFARTGSGPLGLGAVLVESSAPGFTAEPIATLGLRGAQLGAITLDRVIVPPERMLGRHLSSTRRGMWGWLRTFNLLRPAVATMGVGVARAAYEYVLANRRSFRHDEQDRLDRMARRIEGVRQLTRRAAVAVDKDPADGHLASAAKVCAARLAEEATLEALSFFGVGARLEHPLLDKLARDARGVEYMEGTSNVQRLNLFTTLVQGRLATPGT
jgi:alkylation response protein AidB-like acyl-CoA dehydrogenase